MLINGRTASAANQTYPEITEPANVIAGQANQIPFEFYLPPIDTQFETRINPNVDTVVGNQRIPGLAMTVPAGAHLTNRDGTAVSTVSITPVAPDKAPAPLPPNLGIQLLYTSQPGAAVSNIPMPVVYPNLAALDPGTVVDLYTFNHDTVQWEVYGKEQVSADGRTIVPQTNPATGRPYGLTTFSWHGPNAASGGDSSPADCGNRTGNPVDLATGQKLEYAADDGPDLASRVCSMAIFRSVCPYLLCNEIAPSAMSNATNVQTHSANEANPPALYGRARSWSAHPQPGGRVVRSTAIGHAIAS